MLIGVFQCALIYLFSIYYSSFYFFSVFGLVLYMYIYYRCVKTVLLHLRCIVRCENCWGSGVPSVERMNYIIPQYRVGWMPRLVVWFVSRLVGWLVGLVATALLWLTFCFFLSCSVIYVQCVCDRNVNNKKSRYKSRLCGVRVGLRK